MSASDLLPPNATPWEKAMSATDQRLLAAPTHLVRTERQPATCDAQFVAPLAWERSVHHWVPGDDAGNRTRIAQSFCDHGLYGSPAALENEIALDTGQAVEIVEFNQERDLAWPDFVVRSVIAPGDAMPDVDALKTSVLKRKNVRDWPIVRPHVVNPPGAIYVGVAHSISIRISALTPINPGPFVGAGQRLLPQMKVYPL